MGKKKGKGYRPKNISIPEPAKEAKHLKNPKGYQRMFIAWHFQCMDGGGKWPCNIELIQKIENRLHEYENLRWNEVLKPKHNHPMPITKIIKKAQNRLSDLGYDDAPKLYQLQIKNGGDTQRLWGMRKENIFQILWWDPLHEVYPPRR